MRFCDWDADREDDTVGSPLVTLNGRRITIADCVDAVTDLVGVTDDVETVRAVSGGNIGSMSAFRQYGWNCRADCRESSHVRWSAYGRAFDAMFAGGVTGPPRGGFQVAHHRALRSAVVKPKAVK